MTTVNLGQLVVLPRWCFWPWPSLYLCFYILVFMMHIKGNHQKN